MRSYHQNYQRHQTHGLASATKKTITPECAQNMKFVKPSHGDYPDSQEVGEIKRSSFDPRLPEHCVEINQHHLYALLTDVPYIPGITVYNLLEIYMITLWYSTIGDLNS